jgi:anti-sigma regulatory factor (Ser/Thr protein kinase)
VCKAPLIGTPAYDSGNTLRHERRLPPFTSAHGVARDFVAARLRKWGCAQSIDDAVVIVGELFNNALEHAPSPHYILAIDWNDGLVRLEMWDASPRRPELRPEDLESENGRGLRIVQALSRAWGTRVAASGKCVWAILPLTPKDCRE